MMIPGNIAPRIESRAAEQNLELLTDLALKIGNRSTKQPAAAGGGLGSDRHSGLRKSDIHGQHGRLRRIQRSRRSVEHGLAHIHKNPNPSNQCALVIPSSAKGFQLRHGDIRHENGTVMKLRVCLHVSRAGMSRTM